MTPGEVQRHPKVRWGLFLKIIGTTLFLAAIAIIVLSVLFATLFPVIG
jgi:hypothetical protein